MSMSGHSHPLSRTSSMTSIESDDSHDARRTRKRFNNGQLMLLENLYHSTSHPSRAQRELVASTGGMEMKSVTIWFQNKRQTERKGTLFNSTNVPHHFDPHSSHRSTSKPYHARPSLDRVASRTERSPPDTTERSAARVLGTSLWENMPSSPAAPTSPPQKEFVEFGKLKRSRTLEWACAKMRLVEKENMGLASTSGDGEETDVESTPPPFDLYAVSMTAKPLAPIRAATWSAGDSLWTGQGTNSAPAFSARASAPVPIPVQSKPRKAMDDDTYGAALALCGLGRGL